MKLRPPEAQQNLSIITNIIVKIVNEEARGMNEHEVIIYIPKYTLHT